MVFALIGGDERFACLAGRLRAHGDDVRTFALEKALSDSAPAPEAAIAAADVLVLPAPCEKNGALNAPLSSGRYAPEALLRLAHRGALVCAGSPGAALREACRTLGLELADYAEREDYTLRNADLTAEGALAMLLDSPRALRGSSVLIAGYGRIGQSLAEKLVPLGANVTVAARSAAARTRAKLRGCAAVPVEGCAASGYDAVVNTIPRTLFGKAELTCFAPARLIELASPPYGFDFAAAETLGIKVVLASGLPGKTAPVSAAEAVEKTIRAIIEERRYEPSKIADRAGADRVYHSKDIARQRV